MTYYVYTHARPNVVGLDAIFYVGKGSGNRAYAFLRNRNKYYKNIYNKLVRNNEEVVVSIRYCDSEKEAFDLEKTLIRYLRNQNIKLANVTDGGEGVSGLRFNHSEKTKLHLSKVTSKTYESKEVRDKVSLGVKRAYENEEYRLKRANAVREYYSKQEARDRHSKIMKDVLSSDVAKEARSDQMKGVWSNAQHRDKRCNSMKQSWNDETIRESRIEGLKKVWSDESKRKSHGDMIRSKITEETRKKLSAVSKGTRWINNGTVNCKVHESELDAHLSNGWVLGRKKKSAAVRG